MPDFQGYRQAAGEAFAEVHESAAVAWRLACRPEASPAGILADLDQFIERLQQLRKELGACPVTRES